MPEASAKIILIVRSPNQQVGDHPVTAEPSWTIIRLKEYLTQNYPTHPRVDEQRLIYSGHILTDELLLEEVFRQPELTSPSSEYIIHLVCKGDMPPAYSTTNTHTAANTNNNQIPSVQSQPPVPNGEAMAQHMIWMQQAYVQYMNTYWTYLQTGAAPQLVFPPQPTAPQVAAVGREDLQPPQQNPRPRVAGEDEAGPRDMLDWIYVLSRAFVLFSIVYFYSSLSRFLLVGGLSLLLYLYQVGFFRPPVIRAPVPLDNPPQPENQPAEPPVNGAEVTPAPTENEAPPPPPPLHPMQVVCNFVTSFFSSLIPEQQPL